MTTRTSIPHVGDIPKGVNTTSPAHLVQDTMWTQMQGVTVRDNLVAQAKGLVYVAGSPGNPVLSRLFTLPIYKNYAFTLHVTTNGVYQFWDDGNTLLPGMDAINSRNIQGVSYNGRLYLTGPQQALFHTDGTRVVEPLDGAPSARYIEVFFDHLVIGNVMYGGQRYRRQFRVSDLYNVTDFVPTPTNEADEWDIEDWVPTDAVDNEVTGVLKYGDLCLIYTHNCILPVSYTGLPKVFNVGQPINGGQGIGNGVHGALCGTGQRHFFLDKNERTFFELSREGVVEIGRPVRSLIKENLNIYFSRVFREESEAVWYVEKDDGDRALLVFNWQARKWSELAWATLDQVGSPFLVDIGGSSHYHPKTMDDIGALSEEEIQSNYLLTNSGVPLLTNSGEPILISSRTFVPIEEITAPFDSDVVAIEGVQDPDYGIQESNPPLLASRYFVFADDGVYKETSNLADLVALPDSSKYPQLQLTTGDLIYGDLYTVKETDCITIHAAYDVTEVEPGLNSEPYILVELSTRDNLGDVVTFEEFGRWTLDPGKLPQANRHPGKRLTSKKIYRGRVFRWRFTGSPDMFGLKFFAFQEHIFGAAAEQ